MNTSCSVSSIIDTGSEDTVLIGTAGNEVLTAIDGWLTLPVSVDGARLDRPASLEFE